MEGYAAHLDKIPRRNRLVRHEASRLGLGLEIEKGGFLVAQLVAGRRRQVLHCRAWLHPGSFEALETMQKQKPISLEQIVVPVSVGRSEKMAERGHRSPRRRSRSQRGTRLFPASLAVYLPVSDAINCRCSRVANHFGGCCCPVLIVGGLPSYRTQ